MKRWMALSLFAVWVLPLLVFSGGSGMEEEPKDLCQVDPIPTHEGASGASHIEEYNNWLSMILEEHAPPPTHFSREESDGSTTIYDLNCEGNISVLRYRRDGRATFIDNDHFRRRPDNSFIHSVRHSSGPTNMQFYCVDSNGNLLPRCPQDWR